MEDINPWNRTGIEFMIFDYSTTMCSQLYTQKIMICPESSKSPHNHII